MIIWLRLIVVLSTTMNLIKWLNIAHKYVNNTWNIPCWDHPGMSKSVKETFLFKFMYFSVISHSCTVWCSTFIQDSRNLRVVFVGIISCWESRPFQAYYEYPGNLYYHACSNCTKNKAVSNITQIMWAHTKQIGCGHFTCTSNGINLFICNYLPPG